MCTNMPSVGYDPRWDDELTLKIHVPQLAVVSFTVYTKDAFVAQYSLPFTSILQGVCSACRAEPDLAGGGPGAQLTWGH